jgi:excisionase family DNA binding protein
MQVKELSIIATLSQEERKLLVNEIIEALTLYLGPAAGPSIIELEQPISKVEACRLLRCSQPTMTKWMSEGKIPFYRKGRRVYFFRSEILTSLDRPLKPYK